MVTSLLLFYVLKFLPWQTSFFYHSCMRYCVIRCECVAILQARWSWRFVLNPRQIIAVPSSLIALSHPLFGLLLSTRNLCGRWKSQCAAHALLLSSVPCLAVLYNVLSTLPHKRHDFGEKKFIEHKMCVLNFYTNFVWNISYSKKNWVSFDQNCILVFM